MPAPRIAVTSMWSNQIHGLRRDGAAVSAAILRAVVRAGGEPVMLFAESPDTMLTRLREFEGLLVPGGADVDPARYGETAAPQTHTADFAVQDDFEASALAAAQELGLPTLAICRGFQLLNVERGGTLVQDLPEHSVHRNNTHPVNLASGSILSDVLTGHITDNTVSVSSYHHQAVSQIGSGLRAVGVASDGVVEALEDPLLPLLAVQWHPEDTAATDPAQHALFDWLVHQARQRAESATPR